MKTQAFTPKTETFDDLIFEGRNKSYGAFELNRKQNRYLIAAFLISFSGIATCVAVPFINAIKGDGVLLNPDYYTSVGLTQMKTQTDVPLPPPPPDLDDVEKMMISNAAPQIVEVADDSLELIPTDELIDIIVNKPVDPDPIPVLQNDPVIPDDADEKVDLFPSEKASFMGGGEEMFRKWVAEQIKYPEEAARENIFGKVFIEFCINRNGEVVDIKVLRSLHPSVDAATVKVIESSPRWTPAKQGGTPVKTRYVIPFMFDLI